jgi:hypothetical protein
VHHLNRRPIYLYSKIYLNFNKWQFVVECYTSCMVKCPHVFVTRLGWKTASTLGETWTDIFWQVNNNIRDKILHIVSDVLYSSHRMRCTLTINKQYNVQKWAIKKETFNGNIIYQSETLWNQNQSKETRNGP